MLELVDISTYYGSIRAIDKISLKANEGSVTCLLGRNGMGKTTIVHSIVNLFPPRTGSVFFKGEEISRMKTFLIIRKGIALVPQGRHIFPSLTVLENLTIGQRKGKTSGHWSLERVYSFFPILRVRANSSAKFLSGGEQQMVSIARALMTNAQMILMDEPSEGLAPLIIREIGDIIGQLKKEKISFLLVEQSLYLAYTAGDYVYIIDKGRNVYDSTVDELRLNEEAQVKFLFVKK